MTEALASRSFRGVAAQDAIEAIHENLDDLWLDVPFINDMDQMCFTTAVIESASNVVQHAEPSGQEPVGLGVDVTVRPARLEAHVNAYNAKPPARPLEPMSPSDDAECGRGLALIQALVTDVAFQHQDATSTWILTRTAL